MEDFRLNDPSLETQWRSLILFGKNSATYKFAFARSLLDMVDQERTIVTLEDLAVPYSGYILEHLKKHEKQGNSKSSQFLEACRSRLKNEITDDELIGITKAKGFVNVVDAFQNVSGGTITSPFYEKDYSSSAKRIVITDQLLSLRSSFQYSNLDSEVEARWRLVETAWGLGISPNLIQVQHDELNGELFLESDLMRRIDITSARDALNGYQKGKCFYCCRDISVVSGSDSICHVDHFLPHLHKREHLPANINGVWNLVLSCQTCNGTSEKGSKVPDLDFLSRLHKRNEHYISSNHPLAETIINQCGDSINDRKSFLREHYRIAKDLSPISQWNPTETVPCPF
jgi:hypothetical protein